MELLHYANVKEGQTVVLITHDPLIAQQASRIITIEDGLLNEG